MSEGTGALQKREERTLDRRAVERVLARAAELQAARFGSDPSELMTESQLVEIAKEAGLDVAHVRQAIAEVRTHRDIATASDLTSRLFGVPAATASRTVTGSPAELLAVLDRTMQRDECLRVQRRFTDRLVWEAREDFFGMMKRGLGIGGRYDLARADSVSGTVVPLDDARSLVSLEADISGSRRARLGSSAVVTAAGAVGTAVLASLTLAIPAIALVPLVGASGISWGIARGHRGLVARMHLALEQALDRLEFGDARRARGLASAIEAVRPLLR